MSANPNRASCRILESRYGRLHRLYYFQRRVVSVTPSPTHKVTWREAIQSLTRVGTVYCLNCDCLWCHQCQKRRPVITRLHMPGRPGQAKEQSMADGPLSNAGIPQSSNHPGRVNHLHPWRRSLAFWPSNFPLKLEQ